MTNKILLGIGSAATFDSVIFWEKIPTEGCGFKRGDSERLQIREKFLHETLLWSCNPVLRGITAPDLRRGTSKWKFYTAGFIAYNRMVPKIKASFAFKGFGYFFKTSIDLH